MSSPPAGKRARPSAAAEAREEYCIARIILPAGDLERVKSLAWPPRLHAARSKATWGTSVAVTIAGEKSSVHTGLDVLWAHHQALEVSRVKDNPYVALAKGGKALARQTLRMLISDSHAGAVIGRGGEALEALRSTAKVRIDVQPEDASRLVDAEQKAAHRGGERVVAITGPAAPVREAAGALITRVSELPVAARVRAGVEEEEEETMARDGSLPAVPAQSVTGAWHLGSAGGEGAEEEAAEAPGGQRAASAAARARVSVSWGAPVSSTALVSEPLSVPAEHIGRVVGRGGATLAHLRASTRCAASLSGDVLTLVGSVERVAEAKALLARILMGEDVVRGGRGGPPLGAGPGLSGGSYPPPGPCAPYLVTAAIASTSPAAAR